MFAAAIALAAWRAHALTRDGALAAFVVGALTYGAGGWSTTFVLLAFFVPSVALSRAGRARKREVVDIGKGGPRDAWQVLANGGVATLCAVVAAYLQGWWWFGFAGAYAAATADTWGTEIGMLARGRPRSILTLQPISTGLSGGVTAPGTLAEIAGALWIAVATVIGALFAGWQNVGLRFDFRTSWASIVVGIIAIPAIVVVAGIGGALVDSVLGATAQALRRCPACGRTCETDPHVCGTPTELVRGVAWFSNDGVNFAATATGALLAMALAFAVDRRL